MLVRCRFVCSWLLIVTGLLPVTPALSQSRPAGGRASLVVGDRVTARWSASGDRFWYRQELPDDGYRFIAVDAVKGQRNPAFDHEAVARAIGPDVQPDHLPIESLEFTKLSNTWILVGRDQRWLWNGETGKLESADGIEVEPTADEVADGRPARTGADTEVVFDNRMAKSAEIFWLGDDGRRSYGKIAPGAKHRQHTFGGHRWAVVVEDGQDLGVITANDTPRTITLDGKRLRDNSARRRRDRSPPMERSSDVSPDGKWKAAVENHNVVVRSLENNEPIVLSQDGKEGLAYGQLTWSPDSKSLVAFRTEPGDQLYVHLLRSSPEGGGRAKLESHPYALPGDKFASHELNLFHIDGPRQIKPTVDRFQHEWELPKYRWSSDGQHLFYEQVDRGHQRFRVIDVSLADGQVRNIIDESTSTFLWTAHNESGLPLVTWLDTSPELIYASERSGWRHLYLIDTASGLEKCAITSGNWIVRGIERVDEERRQIWIRASGCFEGQDPYLIHYGRVNFDGTGLVWLTASDGNHSITYSPDRRFLIDTYSRVDLPPVSVLRRVEDGQLICELEKSDATALIASGWSPPEVFKAKGRDGQTDIWGFICRPANFDPAKRYPVIEDIYAGPHGAHVPKSFTPTRRYADLTELGFIVVKIDGMGTAYRSKAFHDVCWHNLKDAGFEDRIAWMKAAAATRPEMDLTRVGIFGTSAGGQNAAAAVIFHPEFYKVAVASCGCHDNRMDKASWNEQWMGYPVGPHYAESSNIDNAHKLGGKLLLIVGEMDTNVPPESTMRFADALIRADKDFDLLVVPNAGHGNGGPYGVRKMHEFFVRHLMQF